MIAKILIAVGFLFLLVTVGPWLIDLVMTVIQTGEQIKNGVNP